MQNQRLTFIDIHTLDNRNSLEVSELRSSLLFGHKHIRDSRDSIIMKAVFSIILYLKEEERNAQKVLEKYRELLCQEGEKMELGQLQSVLNKLEDEKLIERHGDIIIVKASANAEKFIKDVNDRTRLLLEKIVERTQKEYGRHIEPKVRERLISNIQMALSVYFKLAGFEFFDLSLKSHGKEAEDAVAVAMQNINDTRLSNSLIVALADTINSEDNETKEILEIWAKAYMSTQVMNLDPSLRQFKLRQLRNKEFILDTDFVLNCLTNKARFSKIYKEVLNTLVSDNCQCVVRIPQEVVIEVNNHARSAAFLYSQYGESVLQLPDEFLETQLANVFIEDYVKTKRSNSEYQDMRFETYLKNIVYPKRPSLLEKKVASISSKIKMGRDTAFEVESDSRLTELKNKIFQDISKSEKGEKRDNNVNQQIAKTDAVLYLAVYKKDEGLEDKYALSKKAYLLSRSTRSMKCARRLGFANCDVICRPQTLIAVFSEIGIVNTGITNVINLFDNPFLTFTAHRIWKDVERLISVGVDIKYAEIDRLRYEYEDDVNAVLTAKTTEDFDREIRKWRAKDYSWAKKTGDLLDKIKVLQQRIVEQDEIIEAKTEENKKLRISRHIVGSQKLINRNRVRKHKRKGQVNRKRR